MTVAAAWRRREQEEHGGEDSGGGGEERVREFKSPLSRDASWVGVGDPGSSGFWLQVTADGERPAGAGKGAEFAPLPRCARTPERPAHPDLTEGRHVQEGIREASFFCQKV